MLLAPARIDRKAAVLIGALAIIVTALAPVAIVRLTGGRR